MFDKNSRRYVVAFQASTSLFLGPGELGVRTSGFAVRMTPGLPFPVRSGDVRTISPRIKKKGKCEIPGYLIEPLLMTSVLAYI